jgi:hypothetical protein
MLTPKQIAEQGCFLVKEVGSSAHGTNLAGTDDLDLMGVCFQPEEYLLGLRHFEEYIYRTARERVKFDPEENQKRQGQEPPSEPGDTDLVIYSVQKYLKLALASNPTILILFFSQKRHVEFEINRAAGTHVWYSSMAWANNFEQLSEAIANRQAGTKFLGYLQAQKERMLGVRGQMRVTRKELLELYGYDVKYAYQAVRLGLQGVEFLQTGKLSLPMSESLSDQLKEVRRGVYTLSQIIEWIEQLEADLLRTIENCDLPRRPDTEAVDRWLVESQQEFWEWRRKNNQAQESLAKLP